MRCLTLVEGTPILLYMLYFNIYIHTYIHSSPLIENFQIGVIWTYNFIERKSYSDVIEAKGTRRKGGGQLLTEVINQEKSQRIHCL